MDAATATRPPRSRPAPARAADPPTSGPYHLGACFDVRRGVERLHARAPDGADVVLIREPLPDPDLTPPLIAFWPGVAWEDELRQRCRHIGLPRALDRFERDGWGCLVLEQPGGVSLWDAWDEPDVGAAERYGWLLRLADLFRALHRAGAILEGLRPDQVLVTPLGEVVLDATVVFLPVPQPGRAPLRPTESTAPELLLGGAADARADLYCFGAVLCALELGRELTDLDFTGPGEPVPYLERFPDAHPLLGRLLSRTFCRDRAQRFPSEVAADDLTGFAELVRELEQAQRVLGRARLEVAAWTSHGMARGGNEDAFAVLHSAEAHDAAGEECALVLVADGMGGTVAGEVAAALAVQVLRRHLLHAPPLAALAGEPGLAPVPADRDAVAAALRAALGAANHAVYLASRTEGRHGMGCTAEAVFVDGRRVVVGHVGDSRTYRLHRGVLTQLTRDQTLVGRLLEQGRITPEEALAHPRRSELQQAVGGRPEVVPEVVAAPLVPGDWLLVCTDGLTGRLSPEGIRDILEGAPSADAAARRLVNRANLAGANDNVTAAVVRAT